jgi:hypothetical protein
MLALVWRQLHGHRFPASRIVTIGRNVPLAEAGWRKRNTISEK